jgi:hypothetical protein
MKDDTPMTCSLDVDRLERRLAAIVTIGATGLIAHDIDGSRHMLRFRASEETRRSLKAIVAAEAECCSFLDLSLSAQNDELVLSIVAPKDGQAVADELALAFGGAGRSASGNG